MEPSGFDHEPLDHWQQTAMYESFFGLKEKAFNLTPDPDFLYLNQRTKEAFDEILYGIERREGFAVIVGDAGTGKTTLSCALLERIEGRQNIRTVLIQNPMLSETDILRCILQDLGVRPENAGPAKADQPAVFGGAWTRDLTKKELIECLNTFLADRAREDAFTVLIIDESQNLSLEMLEQLRLLSNLETTKKKLLQIIFLGQLELEKKLARLTQLRQRISCHFDARPLSRTDTEKYIRHRLSVAGGTHKVQFGRGTLDSIHRHSKGYPRLINLICDRALREAWKERSLTVTKQMVRKAVMNIAAKPNGLFNTRSKWIKRAAVFVLTLIAAAAVLAFLINRGTIVARGLSEPTHQGRALTAPMRAEEPPARPVSDLPSSSPAQAEAPKPGGFVLQVYSFRSIDAAEQASGQLKSLNFTPFVVHQGDDVDTGLYVVYVGPFSDAQEAMRAGAVLRTATGAAPVLRVNLRGPK